MSVARQAGTVEPGADTTPINRSMLAAAVVAGLYAVAMAVSGAFCGNFFSRADNLAALAITFTCASALAVAGVRGGESLRLWSQVPAGLLAGLYFQPSSAILVFAAVLFAGTRNALRVKSRLAAFALFGVGLLGGVATTFGLMQLVSPSSIRC